MGRATTKGFYILGVGAATSNFIDLLEVLDQPISGLYHYQDGRTGETELGYPIVGTNDQLFEADDLSGYKFVLSMGDNAIRMNVGYEVRRRGGQVPTLIHPFASVSRHASLEDGVIAFAHSTIGPRVRLARDVGVGLNAAIAHDATVEAGCYIAGNAFVGAYVTLRQRAFVGTSATIVPKKGLIVGEDVVIGAGAVVTKSIPAGVTVVGNPARPLQT